jgi:hypothetical protein
LSQNFALTKRTVLNGQRKLAEIGGFLERCIKIKLSYFFVVKISAVTREVVHIAFRPGPFEGGAYAPHTKWPCRPGDNSSQVLPLPIAKSPIRNKHDKDTPKSPSGNIEREVLLPI